MTHQDDHRTNIPPSRPFYSPIRHRLLGRLVLRSRFGPKFRPRLVWQGLFLVSTFDSLLPFLGCSFVLNRVRGAGVHV